MVAGLYLQKLKTGGDTSGRGGGGAPYFGGGLGSSFLCCPVPTQHTPQRQFMVGSHTEKICEIRRHPYELRRHPNELRRHPYELRRRCREKIAYI